MHLDTHRDDAEFARLYETKYIQLLEQARRFIRETRALAPRTLVMISCGFDACTYEYPGMQRHGKHVPPQFYAWFAKDVAAFAEEFAEGKLVSVLEGGYSDRALTSGALAHNSGLADMPWSTETWTRTQAPWSLDNVMQLQKMSKRVLQAAPNSETSGVSRRSAASQPAWLVRASEHFAAYQRACGKDARPLDLASTPSTPRKATARALDAEILATPSRYTPGGHMLRDRTVRRTRSQASMVADATPTRTRARSRARAEPMPSLPPATPFKDPANLVPGALPVENTDHTTPSAVQREDNSNVLLDLMGRLHLQEPRAL